MGFLLLAAGAVLMMIVMVVVARNSGKEPIPALGDWAPFAVPSDSTASLPAQMPNEASLIDLAPGAIPPDSIARQALPDSIARQALADGSARLVIEAIGVDAPIQPVGLLEMEAGGRNFSQWQVPDDYAVGWHRTSAGLGSPGNTVLNGHNNVHGAVFRDLDELGYGEEIVIYDDQQAYRYRVAHRELFDENNQPLSVRLENAKWMAHTADERLTLISCWPYVSNSQRLIVIATPVDRD